MVRPSCPALVIHDDDVFRKKLIAALDQSNFTVTFCADGDEAIDLVTNRKFNVVILGVNLGSGSGLRVLESVRRAREGARFGMVILGDPDPRLRDFAPWADETLLKPVDAQYVVTRAQTYCV